MSGVGDNLFLNPYTLENSECDKIPGKVTHFEHFVLTPTTLLTLVQRK